ncbi:TPA_asm: hypothetical protein vir519_00026 [Caudoviricetes sp. vir519]|nr:TPA_asm: hypothetical protein vir519_00026 [Caudoviricetes sp. vir519]
MVEAFDPGAFVQNFIRILETDPQFEDVNFYSASVPNNPHYPFLAIWISGTIKSGKLGQTLDLINGTLYIFYAEQQATGECYSRFSQLHYLLRMNPTLNDEEGKATCSKISEFSFEEMASQEAMALGEGVTGWKVQARVEITYSYQDGD